MGNTAFRQIVISMTTFPRILLVNIQPIGSKTAVGHTLKNLFAEWPKEKLTQIVEVSNSQGIASDIPTWVIGNGKLLRKLGMINLAKAVERRRNRGLYLENESVTMTAPKSSGFSVKRYIGSGLTLSSKYSGKRDANLFAKR